MEVIDFDTDSFSQGSLLEGDLNPAHTWLDGDLAEGLTLWQHELLGETIEPAIIHLLLKSMRPQRCYFL